jgi:MOSC domain-containing protein YiiM
MSKQPLPVIRLLGGLGVNGDAHLGLTIKHRSRVRRDPNQPNLRQVHLIAQELNDELQVTGFEVSPGLMGENITTRGVDLLGLPVGTRLTFRDAAKIEVTGLRNPCRQLDDLQLGLMQAVVARDNQGALIRRAGVLAVVLVSGDIRAGDPIDVELPDPPYRTLQPV